VTRSLKKNPFVANHLLKKIKASKRAISNLLLKNQRFDIALQQFVYTTLRQKSYPFIDGTSTAARSRGKL